MDCAFYREAISAGIDGEESGLEAAALDRHLSACPGCRAWAAAASHVTRAARIAPAEAAVQAQGNLSPGPGATATNGQGTRRRPPLGQRRARRRPTLPWPVRLRRAVFGEIILAVGIIAVTATLVNAQPARSAEALPYAAEVHAGPGVLLT